MFVLLFSSTSYYFTKLNLHKNTLFHHRKHSLTTRLKALSHVRHHLPCPLFHLETNSSRILGNEREDRTRSHGKYVTLTFVHDSLLEQHNRLRARERAEAKYHPKDVSVPQRENLSSCFQSTSHSRACL